MIIHFLSGRNISIPVGEKEKVGIVKKRIREIICAPYESISLVYNGTILDDDFTLDTYRCFRLYV